MQHLIDGRRAASPVDLANVVQEIGGVLQRSHVSHGGLLYEEPGGQRRYGEVSARFPAEISALCELLITKNKHPGLFLAQSLHTPFSIFDHEAVLADDPDVKKFLNTIRNGQAQDFYFLPIRDLGGNLFLSPVASMERALDAVEIRLIHSFCLDAVAAIETEPAPPAKRLLTARERECLIAAAKGYTEKVTARVLAISPNTVHAHLENCKRKLGARNKLNSIIKAVSLGEITLREFSAGGDAHDLHSSS